MPELDPGKKYRIWDALKKEEVIPGEDGSFTGTLEEDGYGWFVFAAEKEGRACLGRTDKYAGFTAVEAVFTQGDTDTLVLKESGPVTWLSEKRPVRAEAAGRDVTDCMESRGSVHTLHLPVRTGRAVLTVCWAKEGRQES